MPLCLPHLYFQITTSVNGERGRSRERGPTLGDLFVIKRGLATGGNRFFILTPVQIAQHALPQEFLLPILPSSRYIQSDIIYADLDGRPTGIRELRLLPCNDPEQVVRDRYPSLWRYFQKGEEAGIHESYLCRHRVPWYAQEQWPPASFLCTYMGRQGKENTSPFRFILNFSQATVANTYHLLYPRPKYARILGNDPKRLRAVWDALQLITPAEIIDEGRVYGGGLYKVEPRELARTPALRLLRVLDSLESSDVATDSLARSPVQMTLL